MRKLLVFPLLLAFIGTAAAMQASINREIYSPGEEGILTLSIDVPTHYTRMIMEVEILDEEGNLVYGDIMHSQIPLDSSPDNFEETHTNLEWSEIPVDGKIERTIAFNIPYTAYEGEYTLISRALYENNEVDSDVVTFSVVGGTISFDVFMVILIFVLIIAIVIWREV
jgi:hypothetical protein